MREALAGMPEADPDDVCNAPYSSRYMSRNRKRGWDDVSYTIPAMAKQVTLYPGSPNMIKLGTDLWEFGKDGETRRFSWREAAATQLYAVLNVKGVTERWPMGYKPQMERRSSILVLKPYTKPCQKDTSSAEMTSIK